MMKRILNAARDQRGTATIELALFAPILATLVIGVIDMSMAFGRKLAVEQAAQRSIEKVMQTTGTSTPAATIIAEASAQAEVPADSVTVTYRLECDDDAPQTSEDATEFDTYSCPEGTERDVRYIEVMVEDTYAPMFPVHFSGIKDDGTYHVKATAGMRTQ